MISTVTTTVATVTTAWAGSFALLATVTLLALLVKKEVISIAPEGGWQNINNALAVAIIPLIITFLAIVSMEVVNLF